jgi:lipopolysaccharide heptosyltransferase I
MRILIIKPSSLGDIIHSLPVLVALRKLYPDGYISWLVFDKFSEILSNNGLLNDIIVWKRRSTLLELIQLEKKIRSAKYDITIDLQGLARTALVALFSGAGKRIGVPGMKELSWLFTKETGKFDAGEHAVDRNLRVIKYLTENNNMDLSEFKQFPITVPANDLQYVKTLLSKNPGNKYIGILPAAGIPQKMWPLKNFAKLCDLIAENLKCTSVFMGSAADTKITAEIIRLMKTKSYVDISGKTTLIQLAGALSLCSLVTGNDTGPLHIAAAMGIKVIGFYGPSNPNQLKPYSEKSHVFYKNNNCSPCGINPGCKNNVCLSSITVDEAFNCIKNNILL